MGGDGSTVKEIDPAPFLGALLELFRRYKIEPGDFMALSMRLAIEGGFIRQTTPKGRSPRWTSALYMALWYAVETWHADNPSLSRKAVFSDSDFLTNWRRKSRSSDQAGSLEQRYHEAESKSPMVGAGQLMRELCAAKGEDHLPIFRMMADSSWEFVSSSSATNRART